MTVASEEHLRVVDSSPIDREFLAERDEILRHKWLQSEKAGYDIGFEKALLQWIILHRSGWAKGRRQLEVDLSETDYIEQAHRERSA